jgi:metallophosphoesterase superfamily enzyme
MPTAAAEPFGVFRDRAVYLPDADALVAADLHLGTVATSPVEAPLEAGPAIADQLGGLLDWFDPATVVLAGDVLHAFDAVPRAARAAIRSIAERVRADGAELVLIEGNHDAQLAALDVVEPLTAHELADGTVVCHGHERPTVTGRRYIVGHDHPVIEIEGRRRPCALYGPESYGGADVLALPAFNPAVRGTPVNTWKDGDQLSPFLAASARFHPVVWDPDRGESLVFPALDTLEPYL